MGLCQGPLVDAGSRCTVQYTFLVRRLAVVTLVIAKRSGNASQNVQTRHQSPADVHDSPYRVHRSRHRNVSLISRPSYSLCGQGKLALLVFRMQGVHGTTYRKNARGCAGLVGRDKGLSMQVPVVSLKLVFTWRLWLGYTVWMEMLPRLRMFLTDDE